MSGDQMQHTCDFSWCFDSCPEARKGSGQICLIPPGYLVARVSSHFVGVSRCFGCQSDESNKIVSENLGKLFDAFPQLRAGSYDAFFQFVGHAAAAS